MTLPNLTSRTDLDRCRRTLEIVGARRSSGRTSLSRLRIVSPSDVACSRRAGRRSARERNRRTRDAASRRPGSTERSTKRLELTEALLTPAPRFLRLAPLGDRVPLERASADVFRGAGTAYGVYLNDGPGASRRSAGTILGMGQLPERAHDRHLGTTRSNPRSREDESTGGPGSGPLNDALRRLGRDAGLRSPRYGRRRGHRCPGPARHGGNPPCVIGRRTIHKPQAGAVGTADRWSV